MASLFESLAVTGHRTSTGAANASGRAWFYQPGTQHLATIYADADETPLSNPVTLSAGGKATVFFADQVDAFFETSTGAPIETISLAERAERVEVRNPGYTGVLPSGSQGAGGVTDLDTVLSNVYASVGGLDGRYREFSGATPRRIQDVFRGIQVSVKDYGAVGNGVADDTLAIQAAINEAGRLGGGRVYFDPGTYLVSSALTVSNKTGVSLEGAGSSASIIKSTNSLANVLTIASCSGFFVRALGLTASATSAGTAIAMSACTNYIIELVTIGSTGGGTFLICASVTGASSKTIFDNCTFAAKDADVTARGIAYSTSSGSGHQISNCTISGGSTGQPLNFDGTSGAVFLSNSSILGAMTFAATLSGNGYQITGNAFSSAPVFSVATDLAISQSGNSWPAHVLSFAVGTAQVPQVMSGFSHLSATSGGAGAIAVGIPSPTIGTIRNPFYIAFTNNSGGAVTWNLNAAYKTTAAIPTTNGHTIVVGFMVDIEAGGFREFSRADSVT